MKDNYKCSNPKCDYKTYIVEANYLAKLPTCPKCDSKLVKIIGGTKNFLDVDKYV